MTDINLISYNVRGLGGYKKRREIFHYLNIRKFDIAFLQETHSTRKSERFWTTESGSKMLFPHGALSSRGVAIMTDKKLNAKILKNISDPSGRYVIAVIKVQEHKILLANIYAPNVDDREFFVEVFQKIDELDVEQKIIGGDFNSLLDIQLDKRGSRDIMHTELAQLVNSYIEDNNLVDIWRQLHPDIFIFTWK